MLEIIAPAKFYVTYSLWYDVIFVDNISDDDDDDDGGLTWRYGPRKSSN